MYSTDTTPSRWPFPAVPPVRRVVHALRAATAVVMGRSPVAALTPAPTYSMYRLATETAGVSRSITGQWSVAGAVSGSPQGRGWGEIGSDREMGRGAGHIGRRLSRPLRQLTAVRRAVRQIRRQHVVDVVMVLAWAAMIPGLIWVGHIAGY